MSILVTTEVCVVYTFFNVFRQTFPFSIKLLYLKQTDLYGMCQFSETAEAYIEVIGNIRPNLAALLRQTVETKCNIVLELEYLRNRYSFWLVRTKVRS